MASQTLGNILDYLGTALGLKERGWSENIAQGPTSFTGATPQSQQAGLDKWYVNNYVLGSGVNDAQKKAALSSDPVGNTRALTSGGGDVLGATTQQVQQPNQDVPAPAGPSGYDLTLQAIRSRLDEARRQAGVEIQRAGEQKDYLLGYLKDQYDTLRTRAGEKLTNSLDRLNQEGTDLQTLYERNRGNERRRSANAETQNRMRARSLNRLNSSFYDDIQAQNTADLVRSLGVIDTEEGSKMADLGTRKTETNQYFNNLNTDLDREQASLEQQAIKEYNSAVDRATALERAGVLDFGEGVAQAESALQQRVADIRSTYDNLRLQQVSAAAQVAAAGGNINSFQAIDNALASRLGNYQGLESVLGRQMSLMGSPTQSSGFNSAELLALTRKPEDKDALFRSLGLV